MRSELETAALPVALTFPLTDRGNAERLVEHAGQDIRWVPKVGWHVYDGRRFRLDDDGALFRLEKAATRQLLRLAADVDEDSLRKRLLDHARKSEQLPRIRAAIDLAATDDRVIAHPVDLDADPMLLNVLNGTVDLEIGDLLPHDRARLITKLAPVELDWNATAPRWIEFLHEIFGDDEELVAYIQRVVGYTLTGRTTEHKLFMLWGAGRNGKTVFLETLRALLGDYAQQTPAQTLMAGRGTEIRNDIARLPGARFVSAVETGEGRRLDEALVKLLTGGDTVAARHLYEGYFEFVPRFKAFLATNHHPEIRGVDRAIWDRIDLIPFTQTFGPERRDPDLTTKLRAELPGILTWAIVGTDHWRRHGLDSPDAVRAATEHYRAEQDVIGQFLDDTCILDPGLRAPVGELYTAYTHWATTSGERHPLSKKAFSQRLSDRGHPDHKAPGGTRYREGLALRADRSGT